MAAKPDVKKKLLSRSERVKCIDMHPKEPWMICALYSGQLHLWDYENKNLIKSFDVVDLPIRCVKFIARQSWVVCGCDDMCLRVYNFNTMEKVATFDAHQDYIRGLAVHESLPYVVSSSDDMTVKLWDWSKGWSTNKSFKQMFEGHTHYVMAVTFNPKDPNTFATASLDRTVKVWNISSNMPNFTLEGHEKGVNCVEYYPGADKPYLISGSDDRSVKIWDYQTKSCIQTLHGHVHNVTCAIFHPQLPFIVSGSEDEGIKVWAMTTYRLETAVDFGLERVWSLVSKGDRSRVAIGCDKGSVVIRVGKDSVTYSMDQNGKIIVANNRDIMQMNVKNALSGEINDGDKLLLPTKDMGTQESQPKKIEHNPNGQFIVVVTQNDYVINTALAWRPKTYGECLAFVWTNETGGYALLESSTRIQQFKNFKAKTTITTPSPVSNIFGGPMLACNSDEAVLFYDWDALEKGPIRKIAANPRNIYWNENGELCCLVCDESFFILRFSREAVQAFAESGEEMPDDGIEDAFELVDEVEERARQGTWIGDCFVFTNRSQRLNYYIGGEVYNMAILDKPMYMLGYVPKENKLFLIDKERSIVSYRLYLSVIEFQTAIVRGDVEGAQKLILPKIPDSHKDKVAQFLDAQGHKQLALQVSNDDEHRFTLAMQLNQVEVAQQIADKMDSKPKWKQLGNMYLQNAMYDEAATALGKGEDYHGLLLLHNCTGNKKSLQSLAEDLTSKGKHNVAFMCNYLTGNLTKCRDILVESERIPESVFFTRSHLPLQELSGAVRTWRNSLGAAKVATCLPDPNEYPNLFPNLSIAAAEKSENATEESPTVTPDPIEPPQPSPSSPVSQPTPPSPPPAPQDDPTPLGEEKEDSGVTEAPPAATPDQTDPITPDPQPSSPPEPTATPQDNTTPTPQEEEKPTESKDDSDDNIEDW